MEFKFLEKPQDLGCVVINKQFNVKTLTPNSSVNFELDFSYANLGALQYVGSLNKTKIVQKYNTKVLMQVYKNLITLTNFL